MTADGSHIAIDARSLELLEFAQIQARLAGHTSFDAGAALALALTPSADPLEVRRRRRETEQAVWLEERAVIGPGGAFDMRDGIGLVERGGVLDVAGLERLDATIAVAVEVRAEVAAHREPAPDLADRLWTGIQPMALAGLAAAFERTLDRRGGILDTASPELADCRRRLAAARRDGADMLRRLAGRLGAHLQETFTTQRGGRPVLAVKASSRSPAVPGIGARHLGVGGHAVHRAAAGLVEANNRLRELEAMEAAELERILAEMSERVRQVADRLAAAITALAEHDLALASARLSYEWDGCPVDDAPEPELLGARHPLLDPRRAVPIDLDLRGIRAVVISGPNTGGKTVALKTLGMLAALSQCGLRLPARAARLPVFDLILADIGDEQSIALNLSTFSAHVRRLSEIIQAAGSRSLVLLDEIAAGTDPDEGGPLAQAIIERLVGAGALVLVTTHLGSLKEWAVGFAGAENAAVAIDPATLRPRYAINIGSYGASHALDIAESLGLPETVTAAARAAMSPARQQSDALIRAATQAQAQAGPSSPMRAPSVRPEPRRVARPSVCARSSRRASPVSRAPPGRPRRGARAGAQGSRGRERGSSPSCASRSARPGAAKPAGAARSLPAPAAMSCARATGLSPRPRMPNGARARRSVTHRRSTRSPPRWGMPCGIRRWASGGSWSRSRAMWPSSKASAPACGSR